jgi:hypothetical protein
LHLAVLRRLEAHPAQILFHVFQPFHADERARDSRHRTHKFDRALRI